MKNLSLYTPQEKPEFDTINLDDYIKGKIPSSVQFGIPLMKLANLTSALKALDVTKATGLGGITPRILKTTAETVAPTLLDIINVSLINGQFPETLKLTKIKPIHKGGTRSDSSNYPPISVLPVI